MLGLEVLRKLVDFFQTLPGIGPKSAERIVFHLVGMEREKIQEFAQALARLGEGLKRCRLCNNWAEGELCPICADPRRDRKRICVVEGPADVQLIEKSGVYRGLYHILRGLISPLEGVNAEDAGVTDLIKRVREEGVEEIIVATNPTTEGEATALYIAKALKNDPVRVTRIAFGVPVGASLEYVDEVTIAKAFQGRRRV